MESRVIGEFRVKFSAVVHRVTSHQQKYLCLHRLTIPRRRHPGELTLLRRFRCHGIGRLQSHCEPAMRV
ncbi:hypothetical protein BGZ61DRAFT_456985, partial [Ilyonectria robusta]|uniref:uncharacterized protein n=1 Tax=Ilyonectria robusta TaxID=1079257 RepID=UPI001E8E45B3